MKEPIRFARVHYTIETDSTFTHEFILNLIKQNSDTSPESEIYAKIANTHIEGEEKQIIEVFSTERVYRTVHNKKLKANILIHEEN